MAWVETGRATDGCSLYRRQIEKAEFTRQTDRQTYNQRDKTRHDDYDVDYHCKQPAISCVVRLNIQEVLESKKRFRTIIE